MKMRWTNRQKGSSLPLLQKFTYENPIVHMLRSLYVFGGFFIWWTSSMGTFDMEVRKSQPLPLHDLIGPEVLIQKAPHMSALRLRRESRPSFKDESRSDS